MPECRAAKLQQDQVHKLLTCAPSNIFKCNADLPAKADSCSAQTHWRDSCSIQGKGLAVLYCFSPRRATRRRSATNSMYSPIRRPFMPIRSHCVHGEHLAVKE